MMRKSWTARAVVLTLVVLAALLAGAGAQAMLGAAPVNTAPPTISGTPTVGQTLTLSEGTWSNSPTSFVYQWLRCNGGGNSCADVANGTQKGGLGLAARLLERARDRLARAEVDARSAGGGVDGSASGRVGAGQRG